MASDTVVIHINRGILTAAFKDDPSLSQRVILFGGGEAVTWSNVILSKRSPLTPVLRAGVTRLSEAGVLTRLQYDWEGRGVPNSDEMGKEVRGIFRSVFYWLNFIIFKFYVHYVCN